MGRESVCNLSAISLSSGIPGNQGTPTDQDIRGHVHLFISNRSLQAFLLIKRHMGYVPFARMPLPLLLKKCVAVDLDLVDWTVYPPRYANTGLYALSEIVELRLTLDPIILQGSVRLIWSFHHLRTLRLQWWRGSRGDHLVEPCFDLTTWCPGPKTGKCESLRSLWFMVLSNFGHPLHAYANLLS